MRKTILTSFMGIPLLLTCCSSLPGIDEVEENVKIQIDVESNGDVQLIDIEKTNSKDQVILGQKMHTIEYKARVKFMKDCFMYVDKTGFGPYFSSFKTYNSEPDFNPSLQMQIVKFRKDDLKDFNGRVTFSDTENGWMPKY